MRPNATECQSAIAYFRSTAAIRDRSRYLFDRACADQSDYFRVDLTQLEATAEYVQQVIQTHYPDLAVPFHSRWRHFEVGGVTRLHHLDQQLSHLSPLEAAQAKVDLVVVSVLLDAGAGADWRYVEPDTGAIYGRSEGLAVASFDLFCQGCFSSDPTQPLRVDAIALEALALTDLAAGLQVSDSNPLVGLSGRVQLLQRLGQVLRQRSDWFGLEIPRPGGLVTRLQRSACKDELPANTVLQAVLEGFGAIWPGRLMLDGVNLGDVWLHPALQRTDLPFSVYPYVPFHKLSQWLTYSLLEPLQDLGLTITGLDELTGLPEYRNGGLCVDLGLLQVKDSSLLTQAHVPAAVGVVEWRALTVILLDCIAERVRQRLQLSPAAFPLAKVLQGGTWTAGRLIAAERRLGGGPPIQIESDGTVF